MTKQELFDEIQKQYAAWVNKILPLLQEYFYADYDTFPHQLKPTPGFAECYDKTQKKG
jgi:hypothetical protein